VAVGLTWATNAIGGGTEWLSLAVALAFAGSGGVRRRELGATCLVGFTPAVVVLAIALTPGL
jgi:hypothetical protein